MAMKTLVGALAASAAMMIAGSAAAEQWVDYAPVKGVWVKTYVHVEPSKIDDYLVALKKTWVPSEEMAKKHGLIDQYLVQVNVNASTAGPNVVLLEHYVSMAALDPNKEQDMAMEKEYDSMFPKAANDAEQANRSKYRSMVSQEMWAAVDFMK
jgi:hypothetical protein